MESMTVAQLRKLASEKNVDVSGARVKKDIIALIQGGGAAAPVCKLRNFY